MAHHYHNPMSFFMEELQILTNAGKLAWQRSNHGIINFLTEKSNVLISVEQDCLTIRGDNVVRTFKKKVDIDEYEFEELYRAVITAVVIAKSPPLKDAIEEVKEMYDAFLKENKSDTVFEEE